MTAQKGRTYDRTAPVASSFEKALASGAVPHMAIRDNSWFLVGRAAGRKEIPPDSWGCSRAGEVRLSGENCAQALTGPNALFGR